MGWFNHQLDENVSQNVIPYSSDVSIIYPGLTMAIISSLSFVEVSPPYTVWTRLEGTPEVWKKRVSELLPLEQ